MAQLKDDKWNRCPICDEIILRNGASFCKICWGLVVKQAQDEGIPEEDIESVRLDPVKEELIITRRKHG